MTRASRLQDTLIERYGDRVGHRAWESDQRRRRQARRAWAIRKALVGLGLVLLAVGLVLVAARVGKF